MDSGRVHLLAKIRQRIAATPRLESAMVFLRRTQAAHPDEGPYSNPAPQPEPEPEEVASEPPERGLLARFRSGVARRFSRGDVG